MTLSRRYLITHLLPCLLLMAFILWIGSDRGSAGNTQALMAGFLRRAFPWLLQHTDAATLDAINVALRKAAGHFSGYALLGALYLRVLAAAGGGLTLRTAVAALGMAAAWAGVDEAHQSFYPSRGASVWDVLLDGCGAAAGIAAYSWGRRILERRFAHSPVPQNRLAPPTLSAPE